jgi:hypothetical protein
MGYPTSRTAAPLTRHLELKLLRESLAHFDPFPLRYFAPSWRLSPSLQPYLPSLPSLRPSLPLSVPPSSPPPPQPDGEPRVSQNAREALGNTQEYLETLASSMEKDVAASLAAAAASPASSSASGGPTPSPDHSRTRVVGLDVDEQGGDEQGGVTAVNPIRVSSSTDTLIHLMAPVLLKHAVTDESTAFHAVSVMQGLVLRLKGIDACRAAGEEGGGADSPTEGRISTDEVTQGDEEREYEGFDHQCLDQYTRLLSELVCKGPQRARLAAAQCMVDISVTRGHIRHILGCMELLRMAEEELRSDMNRVLMQKACILKSTLYSAFIYYIH